MRLQLLASMFLCALIPCRAEAVRPASFGPTAAAISSQSCFERSNGTPSRLEECIQQKSLWHHLAQFQRIADDNPDQSGHGNRDTGTPGYAASVAYVAGLMRQAGYSVTIQPYRYETLAVVGRPEFRSASRSYVLGRDWFVARRSGGGTAAAPVEPPQGSRSGCSRADFARFTRGNIVLLARSSCALDTQVANARDAGARAAILWAQGGSAHEARLVDPVDIPVVGFVADSVGQQLLRQYRSHRAPIVYVDIRTRSQTGIDYNLIADSPFGDPDSVVAIDAHLDSIFGAGMLDNASGSTTILEIALDLAKTQTRHRLRYIWFGGEELGLLGSTYYTTHLTQAELHRFAFDLDVDVTATPNFDILVADPKFAHNVNSFPPNVVPESKIGNDYFFDYFEKSGVVSRPARFGNDGTDSNSFSLVGVPNSGILTEQDCCKQAWETRLWGGFLGNYEGAIPGFDGGCVDQPRRWCDNLSNNDPFVFELTSKAVAFVTLELANRRSFTFR